MNDFAAWPTSAEELIQAQMKLGQAHVDLWVPTHFPKPVGACFVCFALRKEREVAFAAAVLVPGTAEATAVIETEVMGPYEPGLLALREGPVLESAVRALPKLPEFLVVNATGRDHPRRAGLAIHLGAILGVPTIGITERPLVAQGNLPEDGAGKTSPLFLHGETVATWIRSREGMRPIVAHAGWRTSVDTAAYLAPRLCRKFRTPEPLRRARRAARAARSRAAQNS